MSKPLKKKVEFDFLAKNYDKTHAKSLRFFSRNPKYFTEYKVLDLFDLVRKKNICSDKILEFGSGIGNSIPFFEQYFPKSFLSISDVSSESLNMAQRYGLKKHHFHLITKTIPLPSESQDIVFAAGVFHHIHPIQRHFWLCELYRVTRQGGLLFIFEHNPLNPLTQWIVNFSALDVTAKLISAKKLKEQVLLSQWMNADIAYKVFLPPQFNISRKFEEQLCQIPFGAQYRLTAFKN